MFSSADTSRLAALQIDADQRELTVDEAVERDNLERRLAAHQLREREEAERAKFESNPTEFARREAARRELCRTRFLPFVMRFTPDYLPGWVHKDICQRLEDFSRQVANRESPRLMITMPPRHGKSALSSKTFPAWHLGRYPNHEIIAASYSSQLSMGFSRNNREIMRDPSYNVVFPGAQLHPDSQSAEAWLTTEAGGYVASGVGGSITGRGAHALLIDDPLKNRTEAESETTRTTLWDWYTSTAYTRLAPGGGVLVIQTRWHDDDLAGRLLAAMEEGGDQWQLVNYPAIANEDEAYRDKGEPLHPVRYDANALLRIKKTIGPRDWAALYQQDPVPDEGAFFTKEDIQWYDFEDENALPQENTLVNYAAWDLAVGQNQENDFSVGGVVSIGQNNDLWVRHIRRGKWGAKDLCTQILGLHRIWRCDRYGIEKGMIEMSIGPFLREMQEAEGLWDFSYTELKTGKQDKVARARAIQGMWQLGKIHIPYNAPWSEDFVNELLRFPTGVHDDQVDMFSWIGQMMMLMAPATLVKKRAPTWRDKLAKFSTGGASQKSAWSA